MSSIPYPRPEDLLAQAAWMRELAQSLLGDPGAADDVVQETWIAALEHRPAADRPLEPWLARVVRNLAWKRRRGERRRAVHEREAFAGEPAPGPEATLERLELQRTILAAVEAIPEPFRTTVVERYLQGRSSADIARALDLAEGTVRWRLKRGLEELRLRLDARFGERGAWSALLVPLAARPAATAPADALPHLSLATGVLTMIGASKLVLAAALGVVAVGYILWQGGDEPRGARSVEAPLAAAPAREAAPMAAVAVVPAERDEAREARTASAERGPAAQAPVTAPAHEPRTPRAQLGMRFVDAQGAPWKDVSVVRLGADSTRGTSGPDGRLELSLAPASDATEWVVELLARRSGCATRLLRAAVTAGGTTDLGDVLLEPGARVEGRVLDAAGVALAGADVGPSAPEPFGPEPFDEGLVRRQGAQGFDRDASVESDANGAFVLEGLAAGRWRIWAHAPGMRHAWSEPFEVSVGQGVFGIEVRVPALLPEDRITGIVLDPDGAPLPGASLLTSYELEHESSSTSGNVDADGRFDIVLQREAHYSFVASDPQHRYGDAIATDVAPGTRELELRLPPLREFEVRVRDRDGRAVEACNFVLGLRVAGAMTSEVSTPVTLEPGLYRLALPAFPFQLEVEADGFLPARFEALRPDAVSPRFEVVLEPAPRLRGRVVADGKPVAGARVTLHRDVGDHGHWHNGFASLYEKQTVSQDTSDAEGRFSLTCADTARVWLRAESAGWVAGELGPLDPLLERELELELTTGGAIEGRVLLPDGADAAGVVVGINHGDGHGRTLRAGPEGRFRFDHVAPGSWQVVRCETELDPNSTTIRTSSERAEIEWSCTVEAGRTTYHDLDLTRP